VIIDWLGYRQTLFRFSPSLVLSGKHPCYPCVVILGLYYGIYECEYCCHIEHHHIKSAIVPSAQKHTSLYAFELSVTNASLQWLFKVHRAFLAVLSYIFSLCAYVPDKNGKHPCSPCVMVT